jgi:hypothetical protein
VRCIQTVLQSFSSSYSLPLVELIELIHKYNPCKAFLDGSNVSLVSELRYEYGETVRYDKLPHEIIRSWIGSSCNSPTIVPVQFNQLGQPILKNSMRVMEHRAIRIHPSLTKLDYHRSVSTSTAFQLSLYFS